MKEYPILFSAAYRVPGKAVATGAGIAGVTWRYG
jgi:hypothetical protein